MLEKMKQRVLDANLALAKHGLITLTWGNVSEIDRESGLVAIKPSGVAYDRMTLDDIVLVDLAENRVEGENNPSSDTPTHLELYRRFLTIGGITHTHSRFATVFAQANRPIPSLGTTHADVFYGDIPVTRPLRCEEIVADYEKNTGKVIAELFDADTVMQIPAALVVAHGPFVWGKSAMHSVENAITLEEVANMAWHTLSLTAENALSQALLDKHYLRKHGENAYYGQKGYSYDH